MFEEPDAMIARGRQSRGAMRGSRAAAEVAARGARAAAEKRGARIARSRRGCGAKSALLSRRTATSTRSRRGARCEDHTRPPRPRRDARIARSRRGRGVRSARGRRGARCEDRTQPPRLIDHGPGSLYAAEVCDGLRWGSMGLDGVRSRLSRSRPGRVLRSCERRGGGGGGRVHTTRGVTHHDTP